MLLDVMIVTIEWSIVVVIEDARNTETHNIKSRITR